jgi:predicted MPP superfamily phosphohydrolase
LKRNNIKKEVNNRMKKLFTCILFLSLFSIIKGQDYNYAWLSDLHIGAPGAEADLQAAVNDINNRSEIKFVIITGNITERGYSSEFDKAKEILDQLTPPYYVIPGSHDTKWSDNGGTKFKELWKNDNFVFDFNQVRHIGISSAELRQGSGHISPETIDWLKSVLDTTENSQAVYLYVHHPMDSTVDNWFSVINMLKDKNLRAILTGYKEKNIVSAINGIPWAGCRPVLASKDTEVRPKPVEKKSKRKSAKKQVDIKSWGYTYVEDMPDSLIFY